MKIAVIFFHSNILNIYKKRWIIESVNSILNQTFNDFDIFEINYGGDGFSLNELCDFNGHKHYFYNKKLKNHIYAEQFLFDKCKYNYDIIFNTNLDDISYRERFEKELNLYKSGNYDIIYTDIEYIKEVENKDEVFFDLNLRRFKTQKDMSEQILNNNNNVIANPTVLYTSKFLQENNLDVNIPNVNEEDFDLWKRTINKYKFGIVPEILLKYRIHENQISNKIYKFC